MRRFLSTGLAALFAFSLIACGGGDSGAQAGAEQTATPAAETAPAAALTVPDWMTVDNAAQTVTMDIVAGSTDANNGWNYNGFYNGNATIVVPVGYTITINFQNDDQANPHSVGVDPSSGGSWPAMFDDPQPVFEGAITSNPTDMASATMPGASETITFVADAAGEYTLVCYIPAHAATGMWIFFTVSAEGEAGLDS